MVTQSLASPPRPVRKKASTPSPSPTHARANNFRLELSTAQAALAEAQHSYARSEELRVVLEAELQAAKQREESSMCACVYCIALL